MKICPTHGEKPGDYCGKCGTPLVVQTIVPAGFTPKTYEISGTNNCPGCKYKLDHDHQQYCPGCGTQLKWLCR